MNISSLQSCLARCPRCGKEDINWDNWKENPLSQEGKCCSCGCVFIEYYEYKGTQVIT